MHQWRKRLNERGLIAWPLRPGSKLNAQDRDLLFKAWKLLAVDEPALQGLSDIEQQHGIDAEEVAKLLQRLTPGSKVLAQGYAPNEHAGLFTDLADPQQARARLPIFLTRIANPAVSHEWTLDKARRDWYWGYLWHGTGLTAKGIFDDWMWWCGELHLLRIEDQMSAHAKWVSLPRAALDNAIAEAGNWFAGNAPDGYRATVGKLERVFGYDRIPGLFAPMDRAPIGTETVEANDQLQAARTCFATLKIDEEALVSENSPVAIAGKLPPLLQRRSEILARVNRVKPLIAHVSSLGNIHTIRLDDRKQSLYQRIEQARLFADYVEKAAGLINARIAALIGEIAADCSGLSHFPQSLFTLSLQTVSNILDGALQQQNDSATSQTEGAASSDTLLHYLRSLQLDKAAERLRLLAAEAGVNIETGSTQPFAAIEGHILSAYRAGKAKYQNVVGYLDVLQARCAEALRLMDPLPTDYPEPGNAQEVARLQQKLILIGDAFEDLKDNAQQEREKFREQARKGQFAAILDVPDRLLQPLQAQLSPVGGDLLKIDWSIRFVSGTVSAPDDAMLSALVAAEAVYGIEGCDGSYEPTMGHQWTDHTVNTRYWKAHVNSGLISATTLPLWSISLINAATLTHEWLAWLYRQAGKASSRTQSATHEEVAVALQQLDYTVLVCCYGLNVSTPTELSERLLQSTVPFIDVQAFDLPDSFARLKALGLLDEHGLTQAGQTRLQATPYWTFAEHMKEMT